MDFRLLHSVWFFFLFSLFFSLSVHYACECTCTSLKIEDKSAWENIILSQIDSVTCVDVDHLYITQANSCKSC